MGANDTMTLAIRAPFAVVHAPRRAQDVCEFGIDVSDWMTSGAARVAYEACYSDSDIPSGAWLDSEGSRVTQATSFFVTSHMVEVLQVASSSYPLDATPPQPTEPHGLLALERPVELWPDAQDRFLALYWRNGVFSILLSYPPHVRDVVTSTPIIHLQSPAEDRLAWPVPAQAAWRVVSTLLTLLDQKIAVASHAPLDRATRRRLARLGVDRPIDVQVIDLRRPAHSSRDSGDSRAIDWSHRWLVGAHWRNQWHPSSGEHRPIWIAPFVKGPQDRPLVLTDRCYRLTR